MLTQREKSPLLENVPRGGSNPQCCGQRDQALPTAIPAPFHDMSVDLLSPCNRMHMCTDLTSVYSLIQKSFEGMESEPMVTPRDKSPLPEAQRMFEPAMLRHAGQRAQHTTD